ncbi:STAS domain-containing protein [Actinoallomurus spadix]|uniref:STAS domain-containing protein n=1 Tax=Actinoallomurus spadix TaxID=79912 RepID=A0ABP3HM46_9ACTN|nr:STAS domain-containing protein [Actinoallomurus spadix]MCO5990300.1 STAS domain-containing protein [Actinoallomurus spadix]
MDVALDMFAMECEDYTLAMPHGEVDAFTGRTFRGRLLELVASADRPLLVDMSGVPFFSAAGLNAVVAAEKLARERGVSVAYFGLLPCVERPFRITGVDKIALICPTMQDALWCVLPLSDAEIESWELS